MPKDLALSFIIPVYNRERLVERALQSVLSAGLDEVEVLLVDDCSSDGSARICADYAARFDNVRFFRTPRNCGPGGARNHALPMARGRFVFFLDSDDYVDTDALPQVVSITREHPDTDLIFLNCTVIYKDGSLRSYSPARETGPLGMAECVKRYPTLASNTFCMFAFRRSLLQANRLCFPDLAYMEDICFTLSAFCCATSIYLCARPFYVYNHVTEDSLSENAGNSELCGGLMRCAGLCRQLCDRHGAYSQMLLRCLTRIAVIAFSRLNLEQAAISDQPQVRRTYDLFLRFCAEIRLRFPSRALLLCVANNKTLGLARNLKGLGLHIAGFLDNNPSAENWNVKCCSAEGFSVFHPEHAAVEEAGAVLIFNDNYQTVSELERQLSSYGLIQNRDYLSIYNLEVFSDFLFHEGETRQARGDLG
ncbi:hypothetical protein SDC9_67608 [bioreactor metagenome]|uniref:Glycosyltransferase 2-like domain-containing protein n=1 Tax=bioreactor metagenome TaxID=1076179 RepID=A0A644XY82_9ZZZZ